ncbi:cell envelope integrity protein TolA [Shimia sp. W99]
MRKLRSLLAMASMLIAPTAHANEFVGTLRGFICQVPDEEIAFFAVAPRGDGLVLLNSESDGVIDLVETATGFRGNIDTDGGVVFISEFGDGWRLYFAGEFEFGDAECIDASSSTKIIAELIFANVKSAEKAEIESLTEKNVELTKRLALSLSEVVRLEGDLEALAPESDELRELWQENEELRLNLAATLAAKIALEAELKFQRQTDTRLDAALGEATEEAAFDVSGFMQQIRACWVTDVGGRSSKTTVTVGFELDRDGKVSSPITLISASGGDERATETTYQAARRAVLRCQKGGYDLPAEHYDAWRSIELTFDPSRG